MTMQYDHAGQASSATAGLNEKPSQPSTPERIKDAAIAAKDKAIAAGKEQARQAANTVADHATSRVADHIDEAEATVSSIAEGLRDSDQTTIAGYADDLATRVSRVSTTLRERSAEQLLSDVSRAARRNPGLFIAGSIATGFLLSRFLLASSRPDASAASSSLAGTRPVSGR